MEATLSHIDNKENIIPSSAPSKETGDAIVSQLLGKAKFSVSVAKRSIGRPPLQDITHLFVNAQSWQPLRPGSAAFPFDPLRLSSALLLLATLNYRKRKAASDDDSMKKNVGKILRKGFR